MWDMSLHVTPNNPLDLKCKSHLPPLQRQCETNPTSSTVDIGTLIYKEYLNTYHRVEEFFSNEVASYPHRTIELHLSL